MAGVRSASGLQCSHGSDLDTKIPRPKMPKSALPPDVRMKMGLKPRNHANDENNANIWKPGAGVLAPTGSAPDGTYLRRGSGVAMSQRTSAKAQREHAERRNRANVLRARLLDGNGEAVVAMRSDDPSNRRRRSVGGGTNGTTRA